MRIIISPAKKMKENTHILPVKQLPLFIEETKQLLDYMKSLDYETLKSIWKCSDKLASLNYKRIQSMNLHEGLTPALISYEGLQYQYMGSTVFDSKAYAYLEEHLRILSGFYGVLRPFDGVVPYRLEMQSKLKGNHLDSLYDFWSSKLANQLMSESQTIVNLASKEYSDAISKHLSKKVHFLTCVFGEIIQNKVVEKGTLAKMARGEMVRYLSEKQIQDVEAIKSFDRLDYVFSHDLSNSTTYVFLKYK